MNDDNYDLVAKAAYDAGFTGTALLIAICIALAESAGKPDSEGDIDLQNEKWGSSIGLWQIRSLNEPKKYQFPDTLRIRSELFDPLKNAQAAYAISKYGTDFSPWSTFVSNKYREHLNEIINYLSVNPLK